MPLQNRVYCRVQRAYYTLGLHKIEWYGLLDLPEKEEMIWNMTWW